jgi:hypothetical protein
MKKYLVLLLILFLFIPKGRAETGNPKKGTPGNTAGDILTLFEVGKDKVKTTAGSSVDIQSTVIIEVQEAELYSLATKFNPSASLDDKSRTEKYILYLPKLKETVKSSSRLSAGYFKYITTPNDDFKTEFRQEAGEFFNTINEATKTDGIAPELRPRINAILGSPSPDPRDEFEKIGKALVELINYIGADLSRRLEQSLFSFRIEAYHISGSGTRTIVGPPPYVVIDDCVRKPYDRFNILPDERAIAEYKFAAEIAPIANDMISGEFRNQLKEQMRTITTAAIEIKSSLKSTLLKEILQDLEQIANTANDNIQIKEIINHLKLIENQVESVNRLVSTEESDPMVFMANIVQTFAGFELSVSNFHRILQTSLLKVGSQLPEISDQISETLKQKINEFITSMKSKFLDDDKLLIAYSKKMIDVVRAYKVLTTVKDSATNLSAKVTDLPLSKAVGGRINIDDFCQQRARGDELKISASLRDKNDKKLYEETHILTLRDFKWHIETQGFLAFVNPGSDENVTTQQNFLAAPGIAWYFKKDSKTMPALNELWTPGLGLAALALDFNDNDSFEIGLAVSATILKKLIHISYGWNLQTESDFFAIGINPLVLGKLFSK